MREQPTKNSGRKLFKCGTKHTVVGERGSFTINYFCGRWDCERCKKYKTEELQKKINRFKGIFVYEGQVPDEKRWIEKNIKGDYRCIQFDKQKVIVTDGKFPGCNRREKRAFIRELPELLEPITEGRRISGRRSDLASKKSKSDHLALVPGDCVKKLEGMDLHDKGLWLRNQPEKVIYPNGQRLLEQLNAGAQIGNH